MLIIRMYYMITIKGTLNRDALSKLRNSARKT